MATEEKEKKGRNLFTKDEVVNILMDKKNWAEAERVLRAEEKMKKMMEPNPREEAAKIARAIRQQRELDGGG